MTSLRFVSIPWTVLAHVALQAIDKLIYGLLRFHQHKNASCWPDPARLAETLRCDVRTIAASIKRLAAAELVEIVQLDGRTAYRVKDIREERYLRVTFAVLGLGDLSPLARLALAMIAFNTQGNEDRHAWAGQDTMASWLGCSRRTIIRAVESLREAGLIEARRRGPRSNQYTLTAQGEAAIVAHHPGKRCDNFAPAYREAENESSKELKRTAARTGTSGGLSGCRPVEGSIQPEERAVQRLVQTGVHPKVAESLVYDQHHPPASIDQAIDNAILRRAQHREGGLDRLKPFRLPGYIVASLNQARREVHVVKPSGLFVQARARRQQRQAWAPLPDAEFEERRRRCIEGLHRAAS